MEQNKFEFVRKELPLSVSKIGYSLLIIGLISAVLAFLFDPARASFSSLLIFTYLMGLGMCSLFLIGIEYLTDAVWSIGYRRISEYLFWLVIIAPIFAIPVLINSHSVFHWTHSEVVAVDKILKSKSPYLNIEFFIIRLIVIVLVMAGFGLMILRNSKNQDSTKDQNLTTKNIRLSAAFMPFFGISITLIAIDWLMSLEPHWFSTIFGVYYFAGSLLASFAVVTFIAVKLKDWDILPEYIGTDHFYNLGAFMFAFTNFWAYIAFSQLLLIWYANLPEETFWFIQKFNGSWKWFSIGLIFIQFIIPYAFLVSQPSKSNLKRLKVMSLWLIFAHLYDLYWISMTTYDKSGVFFGWIELGFILLGIGVVIVLFKILYTKVPLIPLGDPKLKRNIDFHL